MSPFPFGNIEFFAVLVPALAIVLASKRLGATVYKWTLTVVSLGFFVWLPGLRPLYAGLCATLVAVTVIAAATSIRSRLAMAASLGAGVIALTFVAVRFETAGWLPASSATPSRLLPIFGFAFFAVKAYGLLIDVGSGRVKSPAPADIVAYLIYFPTIIAGPIFRFGDFASQLNRSVELTADVSRISVHLPRLAIGAFKAMVMAALLEPYSIQSLTVDVLGGDWRRTYLGMLVYYFFEYINFSGYTDMAIALSMMIGLTPPENFNLPFAARNLTELWRRWHISFASWLRDYVYFPLNFQLSMRLKPSTRFGRAAMSGIAIFLTFLFCGFWHSLSPGTLLFGALSGAVLAVEAIGDGMGMRLLPARMGHTAAGRFARDTIAQVWTLHVAAITFAPVLLNRDQLTALGTLLEHAWRN